MIIKEEESFGKLKEDEGRSCGAGWQCRQRAPKGELVED
jgi:hypothetical protein